MTEEDDRQLPQEENLDEQGEESAGEKQRRGPAGERAHVPHLRRSGSARASLLFASAVGAALALLTLDFSSGLGTLAPGLVWIAFVGFIAFQILNTGRTSRWRALFFIVSAWAFALRFKPGSLGLPGTWSSEPGAREPPYCHIAIASSILNHAYSQYLAFRSGHWSRWGPLTLGFLWLAVTLALGQAWCSWACFYGGLDEGFSRLLRKPAVRWFRLPGKLRDLPAAVLLVSILLSLTTVLPLFCLWACPLKLTTAFLDPDDSVRRIQLGLFVATAGGALVIGPVLTGKRVFCGLICPFGAWQALWGGVNPFRVTIRAELCTQCRLCLKACPTFAIEPEGLARHAVGPYCNRCGECIDVCPTAAMGYTLWDRPARDARPLFLFCALLVGGAVGGMFIPDLLARAFRALGLAP